MKPAERYQLLEKIGSGSFATVYRARDLELGREVAVKQLHDQYLADPEKLTRYWHEAQLLAALQHPNIITIFDLVRERGWLVMELMQGNLGDRLQGRQIDLRALRATLAHALRALKYLHSQGIIHGDIKPGNLMIDARRRVKLGDFGLARRVADDKGSLLKGTTRYMAPESVSEDFGDVGPASDLYSLGFSAYELMCGPHFEDLFPGLNATGRNKQVAWMMWHAAPDRRLPEISRVLDGVPPDLALVIQRLTEKDQALRYKTADEALSDLKVDLKLIGGGSSEIADDAPATNSKRVWLAGGALAVSLLMSAAMLFWPNGNASFKPPSISYTTVHSIEPDARRLTVQDPDTGALEEFELDRKQRIFLTNEERNILLRDLRSGDRVELEHDPADVTHIVGITVDRPVASEGFIRAIDPTQPIVSVTLADKTLHDELLVRIPKSVKIRLNGQPASLAQLQPQDRLELTHLADPTNRKGRVADSVHAKRLITWVGFLKEVDADERRLTMEATRGEGGGVLTLPVLANCPMTMNGNPTLSGLKLSLDDLRPGDRLSIQHDTEIREIAATRSEKVSGLLAELYHDKLQLVLTENTGGRHGMVIHPDCEITLALERITLADLRRFDDAQVSYVVRSDGNWEATQIDARRPPQTDRWTLTIGIQNYTDAAIPRVTTAIPDAQRFHAVLRQRYAVPDSRGFLLLDPTRDALRQRLEGLLRDATRQTQVIVTIFAHAMTAVDGRVYLLPPEARSGDPSTMGISLDEIATAFNACPSADKLLLIECPPAGSVIDPKRMVLGPAMLDKLATKFAATTVIFSGDRHQQNRVVPETQTGYFGTLLTQAFQGTADADRDLHITPQELGEYLKAASADSVSRIGGEQTPIVVSP